jgi:catechol 2,3-dioxygenase-like lactoylglutathione lyase family enzyme
MNLKSGAGIVCYVKDIAKTVAFYERLGFEFKRNEPTRATAYINWWWIDFHRIDATDAPTWHIAPTAPDNRDIGALFYFSVDNVQRAYDELTAAGLRPPSEPADLRGNKEFMIVDPDGYRLVFFKRK